MRKPGTITVTATTARLKPQKVTVRSTRYEPAAPRRGEARV
jgi:hypothetical protein